MRPTARDWLGIGLLVIALVAPIIVLMARAL
jgi:hypothetical protein